MDRKSNIAECLRERASTHPERLALRFLGDGENVTAALTYAELDVRARAIAAELVALGPVGERALLLYPSGPDYVTALLGCFYAGWVAVPAFPPEPSQPQHLARVVSIARDARPKLVLTEAALVAPLEGAARVLPGFEQVRFLATDSIDSARAAAFVAPALAAEALAVLQYTSGSTASPKGVMLSHANLMANELVISQAFGMEPDDVVVSWLPLFHDMGLIGGLLQPLFSGISLVLMAPQHFIEKPARWLQAIARYGGSVSGAPDFAYRLCAARVPREALAGLDLSRWRLAFCGAEPIRLASLRAFADLLASAGFDEKALYPCYGLAESSLLVTGASRGSGVVSLSFDARALAENHAVPDAAGRALVACGAAQPGHGLAICDLESGAALPAGQVGEVVVSGPSVARGYFENAEATRESFVRRGNEPALRTGDLGFLLDGQLFITGRHKDVIIVRGHNVYPQDVERTVEEQVDVVRKGRVVAFGAEIEGLERIVVAAEVSTRVRKLIDPVSLSKVIGEAVAEAHGESVGLVLLLDAGALPLTTSGKLQRALSKRLWQKSSLGVFSSVEPSCLGDGRAHQ
jgi:acyl-CoA synthetase (AMP-forming)/AMP-acid ligase II